MLEIRETPVFTYLVYRRDKDTDVDDFRKEIDTMLYNLSPEKDIVIDVSNLVNISSSEIGLIVKLYNQCRGKNRIVRIVANATIKKVLDSTGLGKLENLTIYDSREQFANQVRKLIRPEK